MQFVSEETIAIGVNDLFVLNTTENIASALTDDLSGLSPGQIQIGIAEFVEGLAAGFEVVTGMPISAEDLAMLEAGFANVAAGLIALSDAPPAAKSSPRMKTGAGKPMSLLVVKGTIQNHQAL